MLSSCYKVFEARIALLASAIIIDTLDTSNKVLLRAALVARKGKGITSTFELPGRPAEDVLRSIRLTMSAWSIESH